MIIVKRFEELERRLRQLGNIQLYKRYFYKTQYMSVGIEMEDISIASDANIPVDVSNNGTKKRSYGCNSEVCYIRIKTP